MVTVYYSTVDTVFLELLMVYFGCLQEVICMGGIPKDPVILLSYINTQLRDFYPSMDELCAALLVNRETLDESLGKIDYIYDEEKNQYV